MKLTFSITNADGELVVAERGATTAPAATGTVVTMSPIGPSKRRSNLRVVR